MPPKEIRRPSGHLTAILADNLRDFRQERQISQERMAELCGLHRTYIGSVERCERNVTLSTLEVFAAVLGTTVPELLSPRGKRQKAKSIQDKRGLP
jgi:transcriptional regulator with XRE-family HTH domain